MDVLSNHPFYQVVNQLIAYGFLEMFMITVFQRIILYFVSVYRAKCIVIVRVINFVTVLLQDFPQETLKVIKHYFICSIFLIRCEMGIVTMYMILW